MIDRLASGMCGLALTAAAPAAWSDVNLPIADRSGEQAQPKIVPTADGGAYISWFDNNTGGYDVYLQRLDADGNEVWAHNGVLVADRGFSSTQDYGLSIDSSGNALLTFRDDRFTGEQITAQRVRSDGTLIWGVNGIQLTNDSAFHAAPAIAGTTDGGIVVAWTHDTTVKVQKLDGNGVPQWTPELTLTDGAGGEYLLSDMHAGDNGSVIVSWNRQQTFLAEKHIYTQKFDGTGAALWNSGSPVIVFDGGSLQFGNFPEFVPDGNGGAVFGWYSSSPSLQCFAQHILADGSEAFPHNGSAGSTNVAQLRVSPNVSYDPGTDSVYLFWTETNQLQAMHGVSGQRFDSSGNRQWTDNGQTIVPLQATERTFVRTTAASDGAYVSYLEGSFSSKSVRVSRVDTNGAFQWTPTIITASNVSAGKSRLAMTTNSTGRQLLAWQDARNDVNDIYAQNVNSDGSLGPAPCPADTNGDGMVNVTDLVAVILDWGTDGSANGGDVDGSGVVDVTDLVEVILAWGACP